MTGLITLLGYVVMSIGGVLLYITVWAFIFRMIRDEIDDLEGTRAAVLIACLILYTGAGIMVIGFVIGVCGDLNG